MAIPGDRHPNTGERVGWVEVENLPDCQPRTVAAVMRATVRDAAVLKELRCRWPVVPAEAS